MPLVRFYAFLKSEKLVGNVVKRKGCVGDETSHICTKLLQSNPLRTNKNKRNESS